VGQRDGGGKNSDVPQDTGRKKKSKKSKRRRMTEGCRQKDWDTDTNKGDLRDTQTSGRQKGRERDGEQDSVMERD